MIARCHYRAAVRSMYRTETPVSRLSTNSTARGCAIDSVIGARYSMDIGVDTVGALAEHHKVLPMVFPALIHGVPLIFQEVVYDTK